MARRLLPLLLALAACGPVDNVAACRTWATSVSCADHDFSALVDCEDFERFDCDASDYFSCLEDATVCDDATGYVDTTGWADCEEDLPCEAR